MIDFRELLVFHCEEWSPYHHFHTKIFTPGDQFSRSLALHDHGANEDIISPCQVFGGQICDV